MNPTKIEWTDFTSNPWRQRCKHKCKYCYAWKSYPRLGYKDKTIVSEKELSSYGKRKKPSMIFMGSMTDLLGEWVPDDVINYCIVAAKCYPRHTFQFLTKNPARYLEFEWPENCWLGATATDDESWHHAIKALIQCVPDSRIKFISCEPLLAPIFPMVGDLRFVIDWLIMGALTGPEAKNHVPREENVRGLIGAAQKEGVPLFVKDNLVNNPYADYLVEKIQEWPHGS
jgi:protein gp37